MNSPSIAYKQKKSILVGDSHCLSGLIPMLTITSPQELCKFFDAACVSKGVGDESLGKIDYLQFNQNIATATVVDTDQKKFSVSARWSTHNNRELKSIKTACHCPSAYNCRHGVALLLAVIKQKSISKNLTNKIIPPLKDRDISYYVSIVEKDFKKYFAVRIESTWFDSLSRIQQFKNVSLDELISSASYTDQSIGELLKMTCISLSSKYLLYHKEHIVKPTIKAIINTGRCYQIISKSKESISHIDDIKSQS